MNSSQQQTALRGARFSPAPGTLRRVLRPLSPSVCLAIGIGGALAALIAMGVLTLVFRDTLLQWQPLSADVPGRPVIVHLSALLLISAGCALIAKVTRAVGAAIAGGWILFWAVALHAPVVWAAHGSVGSLSGTAENLAMAAGLATLASANRTRIALLRRGFGLCCVVFGTAHFVYADFTAGMIPAWLPYHLALAYLTGAIHIATGLCLLLDRGAGFAGIVEASMMGAFVLLLHLPRVVAAPRDRLELTMLAMAVMLSAAAWLVAARAALPSPFDLDADRQDGGENQADDRGF